MRGTEILVLAIVAWGFVLIADQLMRLIVNWTKAAILHHFAPPE